MARTLVAQLRREADPVKGSRFIATVAPAASEEAARAVLEAARAEMDDASHHCAAWRLATPAIERALDAGEPGGSAGRPILSQLAGRDLINVVAVVTRYFGGTKLGVGGLVRAYGGAAAEALDHAELIRYAPTIAVVVEYAYADGPAVQRALARAGIEASQASYGASVRRTMNVAVDARGEIEQSLRDATSGRVLLRDAP